MKLLPSTVATIVSAIPRGVFVTVREIEAMLPVHHGRSTIRAVLVALARRPAPRSRRSSVRNMSRSDTG